MGVGEINEATARTLLTEWAQQLNDGKMLLFLASVTRVRLSCWEADASAPKPLVDARKNEKWNLNHAKLVQDRGRGAHSPAKKRVYVVPTLR